MRHLYILPALALAACVQTTSDNSAQTSPLRDGEARCYSRATTPAELETVSRRVLVSPQKAGAEGNVIEPAHYRIESVQRIDQPRQIIEFETPCANAFTPEFVSALQRALAARGIYDGPVTGGLTAETNAAIRTYQKEFGFDTEVLSTQAAQRLGLLPLSARQIEALSAGQSSPFNGEAPAPDGEAGAQG